ncbi:uncharacterized protein LOC132199413 [Neocloeon triangulifer]|uniref:uncharacterized protein LOC132199413 n=1 Tax=Neocloeon triangulifer TaxID=2078957 RepID=UPI00286ED919|nr:uncharacterized protein LOC132199413 [Neocloeon triangulifer]
MPTSEDPPQQYLSDMEILSAPSPTKLSEGGHMRRRYKAHRLSKKRSVHDYSTYTDDGGESTTELPQWASPQINVSTPIKQRSVSLTTLNNSLGQLSASSSALLQPRMAQLETLEAKMASIEVSLSSTSLTPTGTGIRRTKRMAPSPTPRIAPSPVSMLSVRSSPSQPTRIEVVSSPREIIEPSRNNNSLSDKENVIQSLKNKLGPASINSLSKGMNLRLESKSLTPVSPTERKILENRVAKLKQEIEGKRIAVKNLKSTLDQLDITDNIDVRIRQAEVEFQLGREELNLMSLTEELRNVTTRLEIGTTQPAAVQIIPQTTNHMTLFGVVSAAIPNPLSMQAVLLPVTILFDPCNPAFGISEQMIPPGIAAVEWAKEDCGLKPNDRIIEANGQLLIKMKQDAFNNLLKSGNITQLRLVVLRSSPIAPQHKPPESPADESESYNDEPDKFRKPSVERAKQERDFLRAENLRLSHRISYLEEQVSDLISETPKPPTPNQVLNQQRGKKEVHVFQKGSHTTKIVSNGREISVLAKGQSPDRPRNRWQEEDSDSRSTRSLDVNKFKPAPPKKPQRLSLLRATSLQQGIDSPDPVAPRKPSKRPHKNVVAVRSEPSVQWVKDHSAPSSCVLPTGAQYHNQHMTNFDARENWC